MQLNTIFSAFIVFVSVNKGWSGYNLLINLSINHVCTSSSCFSTTKHSWKTEADLLARCCFTFWKTITFWEDDGTEPLFIKVFGTLTMVDENITLGGPLPISPQSPLHSLCCSLVAAFNPPHREVALSHKWNTQDVYLFFLFFLFLSWASWCAVHQHHQPSTGGSGGANSDEEERLSISTSVEPGPRGGRFWPTAHEPRHSSDTRLYREGKSLPRSSHRRQVDV